VERTPSVILTHAKEHPVLRHATVWRLTEVRYSLTRRRTAIVVLGLRSADEVIRLRFEGVEEFSVESGFRDATVPGDWVGVRILDVSHLQWDGVTVRVDSTCGGLGFWARSVRIAAGVPVSPRRPRRRG